VADQGFSLNLWEKTKEETLSAVYTKNQNTKQSLKPLFMVAIFGKLLTKNRQFQMLITFRQGNEQKRVAVHQI
jgi:hypothetical protein